MGFECILSLTSVDLSAGLYFKAGYAPVLDATWNDEVKKIKVCIEVKGQSVHGHPTAAFDPNGADFSRSHSRCRVYPNARQPFDAAG